MDGVPLRPVSVQVWENGAKFIMPAGEITLEVRREEKGLVLSCTTKGLFRAHDISPLGHAYADGCTAGFRQGLGIAGPSGRFEVAADKTWESDGLIALKKGDAWLTLHAVEHGKYRNRYSMQGEKLAACFDVEGTLTEETRLPDIFLRENTDLNAALSDCAEEIAACMGARRVMDKPSFHWCSWYYCYHNLDMPQLKQYVKGFQGVADFSHIQIDAGYFPSAGDWLKTNERFQEGMEEAGRVILKGGFEPGIWIAPYMVGDNSEIYREHPDWLLHDTDGSLHVQARLYNEPKTWGYQDCHMYVLDTSHPDAMAYLKKVFSTYREWGYTLFKTDFLLWGIQDSTKVKRYVPGKTSFEYFRDMMMMIREAIGDARWLGCIAPFLPAIGCVDMMRTAGDVGASWGESDFGPANMLQETLADQYFNGKYWLNDPDAVMLRDFHIYLKPNEIEAIALFQAMTGSVIYTSDPVHQIGEDRIHLMHMIRAAEIIHPIYPHWMEGRDEVIVVNKTAGGAAVLLFNPTHRERMVPFDGAELTGISRPCLWKWHEGAVAARGYDVIPARSAVLYFVSEKPLEKEPDNIWNWD